MDSPGCSYSGSALYHSHFYGSIRAGLTFWLIGHIKFSKWQTYLTGPVSRGLGWGWTNVNIISYKQILCTSYKWKPAAGSIFLLLTKKTLMTVFFNSLSTSLSVSSKFRSIWMIFYFILFTLFSEHPFWPFSCVVWLLECANALPTLPQIASIISGL